MDLRYIGAGGGLTNLGVGLDVGDERKHNVKTPWFLLVLFTGMELGAGGGGFAFRGQKFHFGYVKFETSEPSREDVKERMVLKPRVERKVLS